MSITQIIILSAAAFVTSTLSAVVGMGGGLILLAILTGHIPHAVLIPVHGIVQLASNATRVIFDFGSLVKEILFLFVLGAMLGAIVGGAILPNFTFEYLPLVIAVFILFTTWIPLPVIPQLKAPFFYLGVIQTFCSLFVGSPGPLSAPFLIQRGLRKDQVVVTQAALMTVVHILKITTFMVLGSYFHDYLVLIVAMVLATAIGSLVGTRLREIVSESLFKSVFKIVLTALAIRLIYSTDWSLVQ